MHTITDKKLLMLRPQEIKRSPYLVRKSMDDYELRLLAQSISAQGMIEPLPIRKNDYGKYELISGERRLRAAKMAGLRRVPCVLHKMDEPQAAISAVAENMQRSSVDMFDEAEAIAKIVSFYSLKPSQIAHKIGISEERLSQKLKLLRLAPEIKEKLINYQLGEEYAFCLMKLPLEKRNEALDKIITEAMAFKKAEDYIHCLLSPKIEQAQPIRRGAIGDIRLFQNSLVKLTDALKNSGVSTLFKKSESEKYIEYKIRIKKEPSQTKCVAEQLKIC